MGLLQWLLALVSIRRFGKDAARWWVYAGRPRFDPVERYHHYPIKLIVEFAKLAPHCGISYSRDEDHTLHLALGWGLYVSWDSKRHDSSERSWGLELRGNFLRLEWACDDSEEGFIAGRKGWRPRAGFKYVCFPLDKIFGQWDYQKREIGRETLTFTMPEGDYRADCVVNHCTWTRPRWPWRPFSLRLDRAAIDFDPPVGIPGKGENSYDCDDDATYSLTTTIKHGSLRATLDEFAMETLRTRQHRGGLNWRPSEGWAGVVAAD